MYTYIQANLGLTAASLRIINHNALVMPIQGPTRVRDRATTYPPARNRAVVIGAQQLVVASSYAATGDASTSTTNVRINRIGIYARI
jgi:ABC-type transporter lipoprotein component MlaA